MEYKMDRFNEPTFDEALIDLAVAAEMQYMRSGMTLVLEPDLYERFTFTLKQSISTKSHAEFDSGTFTFNTPVGIMVIKKGEDRP